MYVPILLSGGDAGVCGLTPLYLAMTVAPALLTAQLEVYLRDEVFGHRVRGLGDPNPPTSKSAAYEP